MADVVTSRNETFSTYRPRTDWGAIWGGAFTFIAIWSVFGALGFAIFSHTTTANAAVPAAGQGYGFGIWVIILTIIAMYVAGRETGRFAAVSTRHDGLIHGMIMFGLAVVGALIITSLGGAALSNGAAAADLHGYAFDMASTIGWMGFVALFLGWLAAMWGASSGTFPRQQTATVHDIRTAA